MSEFDTKLVQCLENYVSISDKGEPQRRRDDRIGGRLWHGQHWVGIEQTRDFPAIVINVFKALIHHKVSIMVKQMPVPIVEASEPGQNEAAELLRHLLISKWKQDDMLIKSRKALIYANCTRTAAGKVLWDKTLCGGLGDTTTDIIPGWFLLMDGRVSAFDRMMFAGDRTVMTRARAMAQYPHAAKIISGEESGQTAVSPGGFWGGTDSPVRGPWSVDDSSRRTGRPTSLNSKPVFTVFAGEMDSDTNDDMVEVCEIYHKDLSLYEFTEVERDEHGSEIHEPELDEEGGFQFDEHEPQIITDEFGPLEIPNFKLRTKPKMQTRIKRRYPQWRRTTMLRPDGVLLDDRAWDGPLPYFFIYDDEPMQGIWSRGSGLQLETLQAVLNVSASTMIQNLRMGSLQAFLAAPTSGLMTDALLIKPGQVIQGDPKQVQAIQVPQLNGEWFNWLNSLVSMMERVIGAMGIMQGEAQGRLDSAVGYDMLAEIGGSRIVECTQRFEHALADWAKINCWFAQEYYTDKHLVPVESMKDGKVSLQQAYGPLIAGNHNFSIETGSTLAWSESAKIARYTEMFKSGIIDRVELYRRINLSGWQEMVKRMKDEQQSGQNFMLGPAGAPPPRTRQTAPKPNGKAGQKAIK